MNFQIPAEAPITKKEKKWIFDPESPLPNNISDCDDLCDKLWDLSDWVNYNNVAKLANKLSGWKRWVTVGEIDRPKIIIGVTTPLTGSTEDQVISMWKEGKTINKIGSTLLLSPSRIKKIISNGTVPA